MLNPGLGSWIARRARMTPWRPAITHNDETWTYAEFSDRIDRLARGLHELGVRKGDRVGYLGPNHPALLETLFAAGSLGAVFVPLHFGFSTDDLAYVVDHAECGTVLYGREAEEKALELKRRARIRHLLAAADAGESGDVGEVTSESLRSVDPLRSGASSDLPDVAVGLDDPALISYTSGTTGRPKGVMLTHGNLAWNVFNFMSCADFLSRDVILGLAPLYRLGGLGVTVLPGLFKGAEIVVTAESEPGEILSLISRHGVTVLFAAPPLFQSLLDAADGREGELNSLRFCICGGDVTPPSLIRAWLDLGVTFQQGYGLTEAGPLALMLDEEELVTRNGSAGRPPLFTEVRVTGPDLSDVEDGGTGEIVVRGPNVTPGYWNNREANSQALAEGGWLRTGDAARWEADGHIYVVGRIRDAIVRNGTTIYPWEIEQVIGRHPAVGECAVVGGPGENGSPIISFVVPKNGEPAQAEHLLAEWARELPPTHVPNRVEFVDAIPRNPNGKILRRQLLERLRG